MYSQTCSPGWTAFQGTCYIFFRPSPRVTWPIAVQICGFFNGHLVNIASQAENDFVLSLANRDPWIGINDRNTEGDFRWEDTPSKSDEPMYFVSFERDLTELRSFEVLHLNASFTTQEVPSACHNKVCLALPISLRFKQNLPNVWTIIHQGIITLLT